MNEVSWDNQTSRMMNGPEMAGIRQQNFSNRSQDDATVGYFFQRPQTDAEMNNYPGKRWAIGDDSVIEQVTFHFINWHMTEYICLQKVDIHATEKKQIQLDLNQYQRYL